MHSRYFRAAALMGGLFLGLFGPLLAGQHSGGDSRTGIGSLPIVQSLSPSELAVIVAAPSTVQPAAEWDAVCTVTNQGTSTLGTIGLQLSRFAGLEVLSSSVGTLDAACCTDVVVNGVAAQLAPGESVAVTVHLRATGPGVWPVNVRAFDDLNDPSESGDERFVYAEPPGGNATAPNFAVPFSHVEWSSARNEWIAWSGRTVVFLSPFSLAPHDAIRFPEFASGFTPAEDGQHIWAILQGGDVGRLSLTSGTFDLRFPVPLSLADGHGVIVTAPFQPDVIMAFGPDAEGQPTAIHYKNGVASGLSYTNGLAAVGAPYRGTSSFNRYYIALGTQLRELQVTPAGLEETQNLDALGKEGTRLGFSAGLLFHSPDAALDVETLAVLPTGALTDLFVFGLGYGAAPVGPNFEIRSYDSYRRAVTWKAMLVTSEPPQLVSGGFLGALVQGLHGGIFLAPPNPGVDVRIGAGLAVPNQPVGTVVSAQVNLAKYGAWSATNTRLIAEYTDGLGAVSPASSTNNWVLPLGVIESTAVVQVSFVINGFGPQSVTLRVESDFSDPDLSNNSVVLTWNPDVINALVLDDVSVADDGQPLKLHLSGPAATDMDFTLHLDLLTASLDDVTGTNFTVHFPQGTSTAEVPIVVADTAVEGAEQFRLVWDSGALASTHPFALVTITNDDRVEVLTANVATIEGNAGTHTVSVPVILSAAAEVELHVGYVTTARTASAGLDFVAASGTLVFAAGQRTNQIEVQVIGDTVLEGDENFELTLSLPPEITPLVEMPLVTVRNDDPAHLFVENLSIPEGNSGTNTVLLPVILEATATGHLEVSYSLVGGTATAGLDFVAANGVLFFEAGQRTNYIAISVIGDVAVEGNEQLTVALVAPPGIALPALAPVITLVDDDQETVITPVVLRAGRNDSGVPVFEFDTVSGRSYTVERRANLSTGDWVVQGSVRAGTGSPIVIETGALSAEGYWRVRVQ